MKKRQVFLIILVVFIVSALMLSACGEKPLGTEENPLIWAVVPSGDTNRVISGFEEVAQMIYDETGLVIKPFVATEYAGVIEALCSEKPQAHMASLATFAYLVAAEKGCAEAEMISSRYGAVTYNGQIFVRADSGIETVADLAGKSFCRPDPLSTSGWIAPSIQLRAEGINPDTDLGEIIDAGSHDAAVIGVYTGDCDAGSSYVGAFSRVEADYPDVDEVLKVIMLSADIPNDGLQYEPSVPREMRDKINNALLKIAQTEEGVNALTTAYSWTALELHNDSFYDLFRQVLDTAGVSPSDFQ